MPKRVKTYLPGVAKRNLPHIFTRYFYQTSFYIIFNFIKRTRPYLLKIAGVESSAQKKQNLRRHAGFSHFSFNWCYIVYWLLWQEWNYHLAHTLITELIPKQKKWTKVWINCLHPNNWSFKITTRFLLEKRSLIYLQKPNSYLFSNITSIYFALI